jgi:hypothetical protein
MGEVSGWETSGARWCAGWARRANTVASATSNQLSASPVRQPEAMAILLPRALRSQYSHHARGITQPQAETVAHARMMLSETHGYLTEKVSVLSQTAASAEADEEGAIAKAASLRERVSHAPRAVWVGGQGGRSIRRS